jgi:hypothetical protein
MEGTLMVATLPTPPQSNSIKLLDLLTNRYHTGIVRETSPAEMQVELPASAHLHAGQRVRFVLANQQPLVSRSTMRRAFITNVSPEHTNRLSVHLALLPETAVA